MDQAQTQNQNKTFDQSAIASQQISTGFINEQTTEQVKYVLNSDDVIQQIDEYLSGKRQIVMEDPETGVTKVMEEQFAKAVINDEGRAQIIRELKMRLSRVYITSNLDKKQICLMTKYFGRSFLKMIFKNRKEYGVEPADIGIIFNGVVDAVQATLFKAMDKTFLKFLKETSKMVEMRQFGNKPMPQNVKMFNTK